MTRRLALAAVAAIALVLLAAAPAFARHDAASAAIYGWDLQLRNGVSSQYSADMTYKAWAVWAAKANRTVTITDSTAPSAPVAYKGVALKTLVGYFDDEDRDTFNATLAEKGYVVTVLGMDGFVETLVSADIARFGDKVIVAHLANGRPLPFPRASLDSQGRALWVPDWPLRVVSNDPALPDGTKTQGIVRVSIFSAMAPNAPAEPFGWDLQLRNTKTKKYSADMTYKQWAAWAAKADRTLTITDSTVPTATVAYKGVALRTVVGYFDDKDRNTFNAALARKGYYVTVTGMEGYSWTYASADIAKLGSKIIVASLGNGAPLPVPKAFIDGSGQPQYWPDWPLRLVSNDPDIVNDAKVQGVVRLTIASKAPAGVTLR